MDACWQRAGLQTWKLCVSGTEAYLSGRYKRFKLYILIMITHRLCFPGDTRLDTKRGRATRELGCSVNSLFTMVDDSHNKIPCQTQQIPRACQQHRIWVSLIHCRKVWSPMTTSFPLTHLLFSRSITKSIFFY